MMKRKAAQYLILVLTVSLWAARADAQTSTQYDTGTPPQHAAGVSSLGSYASAELGTVNLSNGSLNFKIPIGSVGGRGFSIPLTLNYSSKVWSASTDTDVNGAGEAKPVAYADYDRGGDWAGWGNFIAAGWSIGVVPTLISRRVQIQRITGGPCDGGYAYLLTKLTLKMPDGGEVEFRDDLYDGAPLAASGCGASAASRGVRWHATDGSGMIFINDVADGVTAYNTSGVVITSDGTRYRFNGSQCASITDRNGNKVTIEYPSGLEVLYTDQLGRVTSTKQNVADPDNPAITLSVLVTFTGYQGQTRYFKIKSGVMNQNYRPDITPTLPVITGDWDPLIKGYAWPAGTTRLFNKSYGLYAYQIDDLNVLTEVVLPDSRALSFRYNQFGEVAEVTLPTGGKIQYDYGYASSLPSGNSPLWQTGTGGVGGGILTDVKFVDRAVVESRSYPNGSTLDGKWSYIYGPQLVNGVTQPCTEVQARSSTDTLLLDQRHSFLTAAQYTEPPNGLGNHDGTFYSLWSTGVEWRTETRDAAGSVMAATEQDWAQRAAVSWSTYAQEQPAKDNRVNQSRRYLENGMMAKTETTYDQYNNPTEVREYDFDQLLKRRTTTSYLTFNNGFNYATDDSIHLPSLPDTITVFNAAGTQVAQSVNEYDVYTSDTNHAALIDYGLVSQHDASYGLAKTTRGNVTRIAQWLNTTGTFIYSYPRFDTLGNVVSTKDANGNVTSFSFSDDFGAGQNPGTPSQNPATSTYAFATLITSPPPSPGAPIHTARSQYDYSTGLLTGFRDRNNVVTQTIYNDPFNRPTQVKAALGVTDVETHTALYYAPATVFGITLARNDVLTASDLNSPDDASIRSWTVTDGFGRTTEAWTRDPQGDMKVVTIYDGLGRVKQTSNPFRPASESAVYTTSVYDLIGRVTSVTTPDNAAVNTTYAGNTVTVTDQAGKARRSVTDALGRLIEVYEDPTRVNYPNAVNYQTTYLYDTLDNLVKVTQGSQQRFFMYDSLKRLIRARNPEQSTFAGLNLSDPVTGNSAWSIGYVYDANGNLTQKTDARGVAASYIYDALNRNTTIDYSDTTENPDVTRFYDGAANGKGRFWTSYSGGDISTGSNLEHTAVDSYDAVGRVLVQRQMTKLNGTWSTAYQTSRSYNRAGAVTSQTYPSGHSVAYSYDAAGRTSGFSGNLGDGVSRTYASSVVYNSRSQMTQELFGTETALYHKLQYNVRGQLWDVRVSTGADVNGSWNRGALQFFYDGTLGYGSSGPDNNGNVLESKHYVPLDEQSSTWAIHDQSYSYDSLNRLASVSEQLGVNGQPWTPQLLQSYSYDRWGNRTINVAQTSGGVNNKQFTVDSATNRLGVPSGQSGTMIYDNAGNLTTDTYNAIGNLTYDAENRMTQANGGASRYTYNADGQRTRRNINNQETWQVYGVDGELLAEYPANGAVANPQKEYGYRNGELLVAASGGSTCNVGYAGAKCWTATHPSLGHATGQQEGSDWAAYVGSHSSNAMVFGPYDNTFGQGAHVAQFTLMVDNNSTSDVVATLDVATGYGANVLASRQIRRNEFAAANQWQTFTLTFNDPNFGQLEGRVWWTGNTNTKFSRLMIAPNSPTGCGVGYQRTKNWTATNSSLGHATGQHEGSNWAVYVGTHSSNAMVHGPYDNTFGQGAHTAQFTLMVDNNSTSDVVATLDVVTGYGANVLASRQIRRNEFTAANQWQTFTLAFDNPCFGVVEGRVWWTGTTNTKFSQLAIGTVSSSPADIRWLVTDHLGTPRIILDQSGSLANVTRHDYLPFGEELFSGTAGRTQAQGYAPGDNVRQQFTSKERDIETGLDYFLARYYASVQGRFTSADPLFTSARPGNPQSWNRYSYVLNNPVRLTDPTGYKDKDETNPDQAQGKEPEQKPTTQPKILDLRKDPLIVSAVQEIKENAAPLKPAERPTLTSVVIVPGQVSNVQDTRLIDAYGRTSAPFTGTVQPIAVIPLDKGCNIIPLGNGVTVGEQVVPVRGPTPTTSGWTIPPDNGVFIDIQSIGEGWPTVEIKQGVRISQGRIQIDTGPNEIIKDAGAGTITFKEGPQKKTVLP